MTGEAHESAIASGSRTAELVVASNRGPFSLVAAPDGSLQPRAGGGGLAPSLVAALSGTSGAVWVAAALSDADRQGAAAGPISSGQEGLSLRLVALEPEILDAAYDVVANATLWFVYHGLYDASRRPVFDGRWREAWVGFRAYNRAFADAVAEVAADGAVVLVNDYHLALVGSMLAAERPDLHTVHFSHTPFASPEELAMLPHRAAAELMEGMAGYGACGFHSVRWERAFERCVSAAGLEAETFCAPLGPDLGRLQEVAATPECAERLGALVELLAGRRLLLRSDRVELSKNLLRGMLAFDALLAEHTEWRGKVVHVVRAYPSREGLPEYLAYRSEVEHLAAVVNDRWSSLGYEPIVLAVDDDFPGTVAALRQYDVLLVNPVRDGMNLVAKEGPVLNERSGMLVLSEQAGAYDELQSEVFGVQPFDIFDTAEALHEALAIAGGDRQARAGRLRALAAAHPPAEWLDTVLSHAGPPRR
ncbi:MAG TPA: trehalose-6-phosphate synthase [Acidimicrobiales bacterium]|nr:trehalose-6-phosphate synthase [Acidimicrobiales bacterium]